jgi:hypothetical protein
LLITPDNPHTPLYKLTKPYSKNCNQPNIKTKPAINARCAQTVATPELNKITVLVRDNCKGLKVSTPFGGHTAPIETASAILLWKNAQKNAKKNITSLLMNNTIPKRNPFCTTQV